MTTSRYSMARICRSGTVTYADATAHSILSSPSTTPLHARDFLALHLNPDADRRSRRDREESKPHAAPTPPVRRSDNVVPSLLPRRESFLVCLGHVRAIVGRESATFFHVARPNVAMFIRDLSGSIMLRYSSRVNKSAAWKRNDGADPFELVVLEEILREVCASYHRRIHMYRPVVDAILKGNYTSEGVGSDDFNDGLHRLIPLKDSLRQTEMEVVAISQTLQAVLDNDEDMLGLLLTEAAEARREGRTLDEALHTSAEILLEEYCRQLVDIVGQVRFLTERIRNKQELYAIGLDAHRNQMVRMNLQLAILGVSLATWTTVAGVFGMNLTTGLEENPYAFSVISSSCAIFGAGFYAHSSNHIFGRTMRSRAQQKMNELETISRALSDMDSLDFAIKNLIQCNKSQHDSISSSSFSGSSDPAAVELRLQKVNSKNLFRKKLAEARGRINGETAGKVSNEEVELLFGILDKNQDGILEREEVWGDLQRTLRRSSNGDDGQ